MRLLSRDEFRIAVFKRDNHKCVICGNPAVDAHHIIDRQLFNDGGYYLDNGVSVCEKHHLDAEITRLSCDELRTAAGISNVILPTDFDPNGRYDKWGNEYLKENYRAKGPMFYLENVQKILKIDNQLNFFNMKYMKYPRTLHLPWSEKSTDDDKRLSDVDHFENKEVVVTIKMDGENTTMYDDKIHARSINSDHHPSRDWVKGLWARTGYQLPPDWRVCGENLYALHTIPYSNLTSYFNVISIWVKDRCMSWDETVEWCSVIGLETVPVIYHGIFDINKIKKSFPDTYNGDQTEGYVIRLAEEFQYDDFSRAVGKFVSNRFVINPDKHWMQEKVIPNLLVNK